MVNIATGAITPGTDVSPGDVAWSADGAFVAFTLGETGHYTDKLYVASADGASIRKLGPGGTAVAWSPDGRWIARSADPLVVGASRCLSLPCRQLWIARADGSDDHRIANGEDPSWSPDSERIAFLSSIGAGQFGLYVTRIDGGDPGLVSSDVALTSSPSITWGAAGRQIFFTAYPANIAGRACGQGGCADGYLFTVDATGASAPRQLYDGPMHEILKR
jgi:Tol biopolymer transport system component